LRTTAIDENRTKKGCFEQKKEKKERCTFENKFFSVGYPEGVQWSICTPKPELLRTRLFSFQTLPTKTKF
jgi:hypothetical protein